MKRLARRAVLSGGAALALSAGDGARRLRGVNLAGLEFNPGRLPGRRNTDYVAPTRAEIAYFAGRGASAIRLPFLWERLEPQLGAPFDEAYASVIDDAVRECSGRGISVVLSPHQYGRRYEAGTVRIIGESELAPAEAFASFWRRFALRFRSTPSVIYGLQNEPHDQDPVALASLSNAAIAAIRAAGCTQLILAPGIGWSGAHSWLTRGNGAAMLAVRDPLNNFAFDAHQYLDADNSGTHAQCSAGAGASRLRAFTDWARRSGRKGFLGEFGAAPGRECLAELDALLSYLSANSDVWLGWTYWAGGPWWGANYPLSIEPQNGGDRPQMTILRRHF